MDGRNTLLVYLRATLQGSSEVIPVKVGFRKIELKGEQILVNGQPILFKAPTVMRWTRTAVMSSLANVCCRTSR